MKLQTGLVSVIMANYNTPENYLREAIESILSQTYKNFEFIIIDDSSTNHSDEIILSYQDSRIRFFRNESNKGLTYSLNYALKMAKGEFVARMDSDDISAPTRFEKQVDYLNQYKNIVVCGTWVELFGDGADKFESKESNKTIPVQAEFQVHLLFGNHTNIIHPTAMFRHATLLENHIQYNEHYVYAQDYRMWIDCSRVGECANVPEHLFRYRIHNKAISTDKASQQMSCTRAILEEQLAWLHLALPEKWEKIHFGFFTGRKAYDLTTRAWIKTLLEANRQYSVYDQKTMETLLWNKWAETTYFELRKTRGLQAIKVLAALPPQYYPELIRIRKGRSKRSK